MNFFFFFCKLKYSSEEEEVDLQTALTGYQTKQRKLLEPVDHGKIEYEPFRKNFYVEVPELAKMSQEGKILLFILGYSGISGRYTSHCLGGNVEGL
jgi:ATP-dependent RNA helicase DDX46/PRP5